MRQPQLRKAKGGPARQSRKPFQTNLDKAVLLCEYFIPEGGALGGVRMRLQLHPRLTSEFPQRTSRGTSHLVPLVLPIFLCTLFTVGIVRAQSSQVSQQPGVPNYPPGAPIVPSIPGTSSTAPSVSQQLSVPDKGIGVVKALRGKWCRSGSPLKKGVGVFWNDDVRYCPGPLHGDDQIQIAFDRDPPFEETYKCSTPGICNQQEKLWLQGAYRYGQILHGSPTTLISAPKLRSAVLPDVVAPVGSYGGALPDSIISAVSGESLTICAISWDGPHDCSPEYLNFEISAIRKPGLYGLYPVSAYKDPPSALLLLTNAHSDLAKRWASVPDAVRNDSSADVVQQRRLFLL